MTLEHLDPLLDGFPETIRVVKLDLLAPFSDDALEVLRPHDGAHA